MTQRTPPQQSNTEVETLFFGAVSLPRVQEDFTILRGQWTCGGKAPSLSQNTEDRSWMGHPAWQWSKRYRQDNQGVTTEEEAHWGHGSGVSVSLSWGTLWGELKLQVPKLQPRDLHDQTSFYKDKWAKVPPEMWVNLVTTSTRNVSATTVSPTITESCFALWIKYLLCIYGWYSGWYFFGSEENCKFSRGNNNVFKKFLDKMQKLHGENYAHLSVTCRNTFSSKKLK